jgi:imidazolonepropionase-like amidohydrolase
VNWSENFKIWMAYVKKFWQMGGIITVGADSGTSYSQYGVSVIRELELLQEAGLHPIDIVQIATRNPWKVMKRPDQEGLRAGHVADLIVVDGNPLDNFKVLYGMGIEVWENAKPQKRGGVRWTIRNGAVFDAPGLLRDVESYVRQEKSRARTSTR